MGHRPCTSPIYTRHEQFSRSNTHRKLWTRLRRLCQRTIHYLLQSNPISLFPTHLHHQPPKSEPFSTLRAEAYGYLGCLYLLATRSRHLPPLPRSHHRYTINRPIHGQSRSPHQTFLRSSILPETPSDKEQRRHPRDSVSPNFPPIPYPPTPRLLPPKRHRRRPIQPSLSNPSQQNVRHVMHPST